MIDLASFCAVITCRCNIILYVYVLVITFIVTFIGRPIRIVCIPFNDCYACLFVLFTYSVVVTYW